MTAPGPRRTSLGVALALIVSLASCARRSAPEPPRARFGVFFGGDVQEREQLPLILDASRQRIGIRLDFDEPPERPARVTWELEKPASAKDADAGRLTAFGEAAVRVGERRLDIPLAFGPGDRTGSWRVRARMDGRSLVDRPFRVVPPGPLAPAEE